MDKENVSGINYFNMGLVLSKLGKLEESNKTFDKALEKFGG